MTKKLNEETTYSASVTMNDGDGNMTASINTNDHNELARFLELSGIKTPRNDITSLPPSYDEGWADDNPMNMDAAGYEIGGDAVEVDMPDLTNDDDDEVEEDFETSQADYDFGHVEDHPKPYSMDVYDYKGHPETHTSRSNQRRVNNQGDNSLPTTNENEEDVNLEELNRLASLAGAPAYKIRKLTDEERAEVEEAKARRPNNREDTMINRIARNQDNGISDGKYTPRPTNKKDDKYAQLAKKYGIEEDKTLEELEAAIENEMQSFLGEFEHLNKEDDGIIR